ncbi:MAG TPA: hypothetical protein VFV38_45860 [Ktedonobacteraceae bacterium]|nr:hypothetical protein [Ktedonobacteraceae bacterium]
MSEKTFPEAAGHHGSERQVPQPASARLPFLPLSSAPTDVTFGRVLLSNARLYWFVEQAEDGTDLGKAPVVDGHEVVILCIGENWFLIHDCPDQDADLWACPSRQQIGSPYRLFENVSGRPLRGNFMTLGDALAYIAENREDGEIARALRELEQRLLSIGGHRLVPAFEPHLREILARGEIFVGKTEFVPGERGRCHFNVAKAWSTQKELLSIATGYALGSDGLWRAHSWLIRKQPLARQRRVIDTTLKVVQHYYGVILTEEEAELFWRNNG